MAKAFDLVHKVAETKDEATESAIPFADDDKGSEISPKKRVRVEIIFFYLLLFAIFFVMGMMLISPSLLSDKSSKIASSSSPNLKISSGPNAGFMVNKQGQSAEETAKQLGIKPTPTISNSPVSPSPSQSTPAAATNTAPTGNAAKIQILNGTNATGAAATLRAKLANQGIVIDSIGNYKKRTVARTTVYYTADYKKAAQDILNVTGGIMVEVSSATTGDYNILIIIGKSS